jgi:hypothetical protein
MHEKLATLPDSYDTLLAFAKDLNSLPMRTDWAYVEPVDFADIEMEMAEGRASCIKRPADYGVCSKKAEAAFLGSVLGCILGKPVEVAPTLSELERAGKSVGEWPIQDFISERFLDALGKRHDSYGDTTLGNISYVAPDDDLNYSIMGMLNL